MPLQARAYLLKPCRRDAQGAPVGVLTGDAAFATAGAASPPGVRVATRIGEEGRPVWARLIDEATDDQPDLDTRSAPGAAMVVDVAGSDFTIAFCFGSGRFLLRRPFYVAGFGMRAALNAAVASGPAAVESIGWVSYRTTDASPVDGRLRASVPKALVGYGVTPGIDRVRGVRVVRLTQHVGVGRTLEGSTSLAVEISGGITTLPSLASRLHALGIADHFRQQWPHVDDLVSVEDPDVENELEEKLQARLVQGSYDGVFLGVPDEAEGYATVTYGASAESHEEFELAAALEGWRGGMAGLRSRAVTFTFADGRPEHVEHLYDLMVTQEMVDGQEFHLTDGGWFQLRAGLLEVIDDALDAIADWEVTLPDWDPELDEGGYLLSVAAGRQDLLLMDRKNVLVGGGTSMEVCDLAHLSGAMVHVKKRDTKGLSHLAAQVLGSAMRWSREAGYRDAVVNKMRYQSTVTHKDRARFETAFEPDVARQGQHPQVLAIGANWMGRPPSGVVTTLAKVQLHRTLAELASRGFEVRLARVHRGMIGEQPSTRFRHRPSARRHPRGVSAKLSRWQAGLWSRSLVWDPVLQGPVLRRPKERHEC